MNNKSNRIVFHKLSNSRSKEKFSPYRNQFKIKNRNHDIFVENAHKIDLRETIPERQPPEFKRLEDNKNFEKTRPKLKLTLDSKHHNTEPNEKKKSLPKEIIISKETLSTFLQTQNMSIYNQLLYKIEEQTHLIKLHFKEMKKSIKRNNNNGQNDQQKQGNKQSIKEEDGQNYLEIIKYLQELKRNNGEVEILKHLIQRYQEELQKLKRQIIQWQQKYNKIQGQFIILSQKNKQLERWGGDRSGYNKTGDKEYFLRKQQKEQSQIQQKTIQNIGKDIQYKSCHFSFHNQFKTFQQEQNQSISSKRSEKKQVDSQSIKSMMRQSRIDEKQSSNISIRISSKQQKQSKNEQYLIKEVEQSHESMKVIKKQYNELKFVNSLLYDKINQLTSEMKEKDQLINQLKREIDRLDQFQSKSQLQELLTSFQEQISTKQDLLKIFSNQAQKSADYPQQMILQRKGKRVISFVDKYQPSEMSIEENIMKTQNQDINQKQIVVQPEDNFDKMSMTFIQNNFKQLGKSRFHESLCKIKKRHKSIIISPQTKKQLKKQMENIHFFARENLKNLELASRTIHYKMKAFKQTFDTFQEMILSRQEYLLTKENVEDILKNYPFFLHDRLISIITTYLMARKKQNGQNQCFTVDFFCNKMRQFILEIKFLDDQEQMQLMINLKKTLLMHIEQIKQQSQKWMNAGGFISESHLRKVLLSFNFNEQYIDFILSQCIIVSIDIDNLNFKSYLNVYEQSQ